MATNHEECALLKNLLNKFIYKTIPPKILKGLGKATTLIGEISPVKFLFIFPAIMLFLIEVVNKASLFKAVIWPFGSPSEFIVNYIIILCLYSLFSALLGKINWSAPVFFAFLAILSLISSYKKAMLGQPLFPWDIYMVKLVFNLLPILYRSVNIFNILLVLVSIGIVMALSIYVKKAYMPIRIRIISGILSAFFLVSLAASPHMTYIFLPKFGISNMDWVQLENYDKNGFCLAFIMNIKNTLINKPENYNEKTVLNSFETITSTKPVSSLSNTSNVDKSVKPNLIIIMSEAFWDPTLMKNVSFSSDPIPTFRKLSSEYSSGHLLSPSYGGGTSNVEFEILTGNSMSFLPDGSNPYQQYIYKSTPSLASVLASNGYESIGLHTYFKWFFNRDKVYPLLGFDKFIGLEDLVRPKNKGPYVSDEEIPKIIIKEYEKAKKPVFMFTITMQNHGPYDIKRYNQPFDVTVSSGNLSKQSLSILQDYTQGIHDADNSLKTVVDYFSKIKEPTVVVFFGDHLPLLGNDFSVYKELGYIASDKIGWSREEYKKMYSPPVVIWTNYKQSRQDIQTIGASFFSEYLFDFIGMQKPPYFEFLKQIRKVLPGDTKYLKIASGNTLYDGLNLPPNLKNLENTYWLFQYDMMFGKNYLKKYLFNENK